MARGFARVRVRVPYVQIRAPPRRSASATVAAIAMMGPVASAGAGDAAVGGRFPTPPALALTVD